MQIAVTPQQLREQVQLVSEVQEWPELLTVFDRAGNVPHPDWHVPLLTASAMGADYNVALAGAAALACLQISIMLADDILDEDPRGEHIRRGFGQTTNLALAYQSLAFTLVERAEISDKNKIAVITSLARAALATCAGQNLDSLNFESEEDYWRVVKAKSTPFYGSAYEIGVYFADSDYLAARSFYEFGVVIGEIIQIQDDLADAFDRPANPDWRKRASNLLIIYGLNASYEGKARFLELLDEIEAGDEDALSEAQLLLISSGAVGFAVYQLVERYQDARSLLEKIGPVDPGPISDLLDEYSETLLSILRLSGFEVDRSVLTTS